MGDSLECFYPSKAATVEGIVIIASLSHCAFCSCFVLKSSDHWKTASVDDWELDIVEIYGDEKILGHRAIDGAICKVLQNKDNKIVALTKS